MAILYIECRLVYECHDSVRTSIPITKPYSRLKFIEQSMSLFGSNIIDFSKYPCEIKLAGICPECTPN